jgi:hypothetical protein
VRDDDELRRPSANSNTGKATKAATSTACNITS